MKIRQVTIFTILTQTHRRFDLGVYDEDLLGAMDFAGPSSS
jgi:hypothetical protein